MALSAGAAIAAATPADTPGISNGEPRLRAALDWLRDRLAPIFESQAQNCISRIRGRGAMTIIRVILDRSEESRATLSLPITRFVLSNRTEQVTVLKLLEMQRHAMLMYTSCGWFFDELSGIETVQVIHYAGRALRLAEEVSGESIEAEFLQHLAKAKSNLPEHGDGRADLRKVGEARRYRYPARCGPLRDQFVVRKLLRERLASTATRWTG